MSDILGLFTWNLDHFLDPYFGFDIENLNIFTCKILSFTQYFSLQSSSLLQSFVTIDRYITISKKPGSFFSRLPFSTSRSAHYWSLCIISTVFLINAPFLYFNKYLIISNNLNENLSAWKNLSNTQELFFNQNKCESISRLNLQALWDNMNLIINSDLPITLMIIFSFLLHFKTKALRILCNKTRTLMGLT